METRDNLRKIALLAGAALLSTGAWIGVASLPLLQGTATVSEAARYSVNARIDATTPKDNKFETVASR